MVKKYFPKLIIIMSLFAVMFVALPMTSRAEVDSVQAKEQFNEGIKAEKEGNIEGAILAYNAAIGLDPDFIDPYLNVGAIYFKQHNYEKALKNFKTVSEKDPNNVDAFANIGRVEYKLRRYVEASAAFQKAIDLKPDDTDLYSELAKVYYASRNYPELLSTIEACHAKGGGDYLTWYMMGKAYQKTDKNAKAVEAFQSSIKAKDDNPNAHFALGQIYLQRENYNQAASEFRNALKFNPEYYQAQYNYAIAVESNDPDAISKNITNWEKFITIAKKNPKAKNDVAVAQQHVKELKERKEKLDLQ